MKKTIVCICSRLDAEHYLEEWLKYHFELGYDEAAVYLNNVNDPGTLLKLKETDFGGPVKFVKFDGYVQQLNAYNHFLNSDIDTDIATVIDVDEFVRINSDRTLDQIIEDYKDYSQVSFNWRLFGSNGIKETGDRTVLKRFTRCERNLNQHVKTGFLNLNLLRKSGMYTKIAFYGPHNTNLKGINLEKHYFYGPFNRENLDRIHEIELWHYVTKSEEECRERRSMVRADTPTPREEGWEAFFKAHDKNEIEAKEIHL